MLRLLGLSVARPEASARQQTFCWQWSSLRKIVLAADNCLASYGPIKRQKQPFSIFGNFSLTSALRKDVATKRS